LSSKPVFCRNSAELTSRLPKRFLKAPQNIGAGPFALFIIRERVGSLRSIRKCLSATPTDFKTVVASEAITYEARLEIESVGGSVIALNHHHWTEKSNKSVQVDIGSRVKRPPK